jgi:hypothetical protein
MINRSILTNNAVLGIFIDSMSFNELLDTGNLHAATILKYICVEFFEFIRSPDKVSHDALGKITAYVEKYDNDGNLDGMEIYGEDLRLRKDIGFGYRMKDIELIGKMVYEDSTFDEDSKKELILVFIQAAFNRFEKHNIFITGNNVLLKKRLWFESHFPGYPLNIVSVSEAKEIMDLFAKMHYKYYISGNFSLNKGYYYWHSFRSKVPHYHPRDKYLQALAKRFVNLLMSLDEIGFNYHRDANNDTSDDIMYHFNYFISLVTGIFDSIALSTKEHYKIDFSDAKAQKISLRRKVGKDFLKAIREQNPTLRNHINEYVNFINLIYMLRENILHREMLENTIYEKRGSDENWKAVFIKIDSDIKNLILNCNDIEKQYDPLSKWGLFDSGKYVFLEPYNFVKSVTRKLIIFTNQYFKILGFTNSIVALKSKSKGIDFAKTMAIYKRDNIGF